MGHEGEAEGGMGLAEAVVELQGPGRRLLGLAERLVGRQEVEPAEDVVRVGDADIREGVQGVEIDG